MSIGSVGVCRGRLFVRPLAKGKQACCSFLCSRDLSCYGGGSGQSNRLSRRQIVIMRLFFVDLFIFTCAAVVGGERRTSGLSFFCFFMAKVVHSLVALQD